MSARTGAVSVTDKHGRRVVNVDLLGYAVPVGRVKRTDELVLGDLVRLPGGLIRTVDVIKDSGYVNYRNEPILAVMYCEGRTAEWSEGNSSIARGTWEIVE